MTLDINEGTRPSLLQLGRLASGEIADDALPALGDAERETLAAIEAARAKVRPFDATALRARSSSVVVPAPAVPAPANRPWLIGVALLAALLLGWMFLPRATLTETVPEGGVLFRGGGVQVYVLEGQALVPWDGEALGEGDVVGFKVDGTGHRSAVLLSVDGTGQTTVLWPEGGADAEPLRGDGLVPLPGTLTLDDAPGPETFVVVYDQSADAALSRAEQIVGSEGASGLLRWADDAREVDAIVVPRVR